MDTDNDKKTRQSSQAPSPSYVFLPKCHRPYPALLDFFERRFPKIGREVWRARIEAGKVTDEQGKPVTLDTPYRPYTKLRYYREVETEPEIPFLEQILFQNEHLLVVCKPHFLPVTPSGPYVNQCLLYRLKTKTGIEDLVPIHRIDRETAGIVLFSVNKDTRGLYHDLFKTGHVRKIYEAIAPLPRESEKREWIVQSRIVPGEPWFLMKHVEGPVNAITHIYLLDHNDQYGYFRLEPLTGKQHQLRLHMNLIGCPILNDRFYPVLYPKGEDDFANPLQLLAKEVYFLDPVTQQMMEFCATRQLAWECNLSVGADRCVCP
jgi:tRNA pseudouridine32 synthase/23S rRNA pseudouridine746 synthase